MFIINWLAQRNIGSWFGLKWDPSTDFGHQNKLMTKSLNEDLYSYKYSTLPTIQKLIDDDNLAEANLRAYDILLLLPSGNNTEFKGIEKQARILFEQTKHSVPFYDPDSTSDLLYSKAADEYQKVNTGSIPDIDDKKKKAIDVANLCQRSIYEDIQNGDAHVLLTTAYIYLADHCPEASDLIWNMAVVVIHRWGNYPVRTKFEDNGETLFNTLMSEFAKKYPALSAPYYLWSTNRMQYNQAICPGEFSASLPEYL